MRLPDFSQCNFIKKSSINANGKTEKVLIYKLKTDDKHSFMFTCPGCGSDNDYKETLQTKKIKEGGKNKEVYVFRCTKCGAEFSVERLKTRGAPKAS